MRKLLATEAAVHAHASQQLDETLAEFRRAFDVDALDPGTVVSEIIMIPEETDLLAHAEAKGHPVHYGRPMLDEQARLIASFIGCPFPQ